MRGLATFAVVLAALGGLGLRLIPQLLAAQALATDAADFAETPCTDVIPTAVRYDTRHRAYYRPRFICEYTVAGVAYRIDEPNPALELVSKTTEYAARETAREYAAKYPPRAYYDPNNPARAVMSRYVVVDRSEWLLVIGGALCLVGALISLAVIIVRYRRVLHAREDFPTARVRES
ncbi:MAG TPA: hypothetical protein VGL61_20230 [Kofleriaceae bacterium]|jgi:hypothetical protein